MNIKEARRHTKAGKYRSRFGHYEIAQRRLARFYDNHPEALRARIEQPETVRFWGQDYVRTPLLVREKLGDGLNLIYFTPLNTRPNCYIARVDSRWIDNGSGDGDADERWYDEGLESLYDLIENQFGASDYYCEECGESGYSDSNCECQKYRDWPSLNSGSGCCWGRIAWPA